MSVSVGTRLGPYDIVALLGAGGMGEVYRATDSRLKRQVAIKILPAALAAESSTGSSASRSALRGDRLARFQREAEVLASLNHPHIAAVYGLEDTGGVQALVMELVEGPTLADRIAQGPIPVDEALAIARQIADALEAAHGQGIVHRDLKPANVKVRDDGTVKVLDFGLAKLTERATASQVDPAQSPTFTSPAMTEMGMILGTAAYMSPEQARGRPVDKRTDVWAFGAVLYEMLTGRRAFDGEDTTDVMASVVKSTPDWTALPRDVPPHVVTLVQRCLEKDRNARIGDIAVARFLLANPQTIAAPAPPAATPVRVPASSRTRMLPFVLGAALIGAAIGWFVPRRSAGAPAPVTHLQMTVQTAEHLSGSIASFRPSRTAMAVSPDGRMVVFSATRGPTSQLYLRDMDRPDASPIPGTEGGAGPFFSPDGAWVGFWADDKIKKVPLAGGPAAAICDVPPGGSLGASWGEDGAIYFATHLGVFRVPAAGGASTAVTKAGDERHLLPRLLPGGRAILMTTVTYGWNTANVVLQPLDGGERRVLVPGGTDARYVDTGHIVYMKDGTLMAVPFDIRSQQVTGPSVALIEGVMQAINMPNDSDDTGAGQFTISPSGTLLYAVGGVNPLSESALVWVDRNGASQPLTVAPPAAYFSPRLSPDGHKLAVAVRGGTTNRNTDIWVYDVMRGVPQRLTFDGGGMPAWSPDGRRLVYSNGASGANNLYAIGVDGGKPERLTTSEEQQFPSTWASAANLIAFLQVPRHTPNAIWVLPMDGARKPAQFLESRFDLLHPALAPDGRWIAYVSNESGTYELYVQPYPGPGERIRISTAGGFEPIWTSSGRELLFRSGTATKQQFFSAGIASLSPFRADTPRLLFEAKAGEYDSTAPERSWDVTADGRRFILVKPGTTMDKPVTEMHVVLNWTEELKRRVPSK